MGKWPRDLEVYINDRWEETAGYNHSNYAPTLQPQLDAIAQEAEQQYALGRKIMDAIPKEDLNRCRKLYAFKHTGLHDENELCPCSSKEVGEYLVPNYVTLITEVRKLKELLA